MHDKHVSGPVILASGSPRRRAIFNMLGLPYRAVAVHIDESVLPGETPVAAVRRLAWSKAQAALSVAGGIVIGADTIVVLDEEILGKPAGDAEARDMLERLRGRQHEVITGLAILNGDDQTTGVSSTVTTVWMRDYSDQDIASYIACNGPFDKAGGYAIQSASFRPVERIDGCYLNVVGLPVCGLIVGLRLIAPGVTWSGSAELRQQCAGCRDDEVIWMR